MLGQEILRLEIHIQLDDIKAGVSQDALKGEQISSVE